MSAASVATAPAFGRFFLPGPTDVHPEVLAAMQRPMIGHRSGAMEQLLARLEAPLAAVVREFDDVLLLVDAVTSLAGSPVETDRWGGGRALDFVLTGSQKALALPPGLALGVASERLVERAKTLPARGLYFDVVSFL